MVNWEVDPLPFIPKGFTLAEQVQRPPLRHEVFVAGCFSQFNEDLAIVKLHPSVHKDDFDSLAEALRSFFEDIHEVHVSEVAPCPLSDAFVCFHSALEREKFLGPVFSFGPNTMIVIKHDEAENARTFDLDRETWVMLVGFPEDLKCTNIVAKAVSTFGVLVDWFEPSNLARVVAKVYLNDVGKILDSVKVNAGIPNKGKSWTSSCYVLKKSNILPAQDEEAFVTIGPLHPVPPPAPHWLGVNLNNSSNATPSASDVGTAMNVDGVGHSRWMDHSTPGDSFFIADC